MRWWSPRRLLAEQGHEVFPRWSLWGALALSAAAGIWGWQVGGHDFLVNLLASLTLLGPGLFLAHVVAERWRQDRDWNRVSPRITSSIDQVVDNVYGALCPPAEALQLQRFRFHWQPENPLDDPRVVDLQPLSGLIQDLRDLSAECSTWCRVLELGRAQPLVLPLPPLKRMLSCPAELERALAPLDPSVSIRPARLRLDLLETHLHTADLAVQINGVPHATPGPEIASHDEPVSVTEESLHSWVAAFSQLLAQALEEVRLEIVRAAPPTQIRQAPSPSSPEHTPQHLAGADDRLAYEILTSPH